MKNRTHFPRYIGDPVWRDSEYICALADDDRHLGHAIQTGGWHAYDGTKLDSDGAGFKYLGQFKTAAEAKVAVERSAKQAELLVRAAGR